MQLVGQKLDHCDGLLMALESGPCCLRFHVENRDVAIREADSKSVSIWRKSESGDGGSGVGHSYHWRGGWWRSFARSCTPAPRGTQDEDDDQQKKAMVSLHWVSRMILATP